ncbi:MAG: hypothetical protein ACTSWN_16370 [Promethearchaeota archaeon]
MTGEMPLPVHFSSSGNHELPNFLECEICKQNIISAQHYCQDCRIVFCDDCKVQEKREILVCSNCGLNLLANNEKTGELYCSQCGPEISSESGLVKIYKEEIACPNCGSTNTSDVAELQNKLKAQYRDIIIDSRNVLRDFENFYNLLSLVKQKLLRLRFDPPAIIHQPRFEDEIYSMMKEALVIEQRVLNRFNGLFTLIKGKLPYFNGTRSWKTFDFPMIESFIHQLHTDFLRFIGDISEAFTRPLEVIENIKVRIRYYEEIKNFFIKYIHGGIISLKRDEYPVIYIEDVKIESDDDYKGRGHVLITTKNVIFIRIQGLLKKSDSLLFSYPVNKLVSIDNKGRIIKKLNLRFEGISISFIMDKAKRSLMVKYLEQILDFENNNKINDEKLLKIKDFDINSMYRVKRFIEENINSLISALGGKTNDIKIVNSQPKVDNDCFPDFPAGSPGYGLKTGIDEMLNIENELNHGYLGRNSEETTVTSNLDLFGSQSIHDDEEFLCENSGLSPRHIQDARKQTNKMQDAINLGIFNEPAYYQQHPKSRSNVGDIKCHVDENQFTRFHDASIMNEGCRNFSEFVRRPVSHERKTDRSSKKDEHFSFQAGSFNDDLSAGILREDIFKRILSHQVNRREHGGWQSPTSGFTPNGADLDNISGDPSSFESFIRSGGVDLRNPGSPPNNYDVRHQINKLLQVLNTLEYKRISISETLKNLENKFESGKIDTEVYFNTHQLWMEKLLNVQQRIRSIKGQIRQSLKNRI